jgi:hypothetical protein
MAGQRMQVDALALALRPRSMMEATDLGVRLVQVRAASVWRTFVPLYAVVAAIALSTVEIAGWLPPLIVFWFKPWLDRSLLFVLSRAVFGQDTRFADLWQAQRSVWWGQLLHTLSLRRLSPWRSFTQAVYQLEGQHGAARRKRRAQFMRGKKGAATAMHFAFAQIELIFAVALISLAFWFDPDWHSGRTFFDLLRGESGPAASLTYSGVYAAVVLALEPFYVAAGFAMYLNRRVELEAWDIEQEFRRAFAV